MEKNKIQSFLDHSGLARRWSLETEVAVDAMGNSIALVGDREAEWRTCFSRIDESAPIPRAVAFVYWASSDEGATGFLKCRVEHSHHILAIKIDPSASDAHSLASASAALEKCILFTLESKMRLGA